MKIVDLRSDTVTRPGDGMRDAIAHAEVGDDVHGDDPTVIALESYSAERLGKQAALFCSSGTQANLIAVLCHCQRGDEYIAGQKSHTYHDEAGGAAVLGAVQPQPLDTTDHGVIPLDALQAAIKRHDFHYARTRLVCLENTFSGACLPEGYAAEVRTICDANALLMHLDGARLFNAAIRTGQSVATLAAPFETVSFCLSKGLGAPVGSMLCGSEELIRDARRWRKMLGGGTRQAGMMAAAGLYALENNVDRLADDHANARRLSDGLMGLPGVVIHNEVETNMVFLDVSPPAYERLFAVAQERDILLFDERPMRLVTHMDVDADDIDRVIEMFNDVCKQE